METYKQEEKERSRELLWEHAVKSLTQERAMSRVLREDYLDNLKAFRRDKDIREYLARFEPSDKYKMFSSLYCYNTKWVYIVQEVIHSSSRLDRGFQPYKGEIKVKPTKIREDLKVDSLKIDLMKSFIKECKDAGTEVILTICKDFHSTVQNKAERL